MRLVKFIIVFLVQVNVITSYHLTVRNIATDDNISDENLSEGDLIDFTPEIVEYEFMSANRKSEYKWPNAIIPYVFKNNFGSNLLNTLLAAMKQIEAVTCVRFVPFDQRFHKDVSPLKIIEAQKQRCASTVGRNQFKGSKLFANPKVCLDGNILHELMHTIGFVHEQNREDRDNFVRVMLENVMNSKKKDFDKTAFPYEIYTPYDYDSITHYGNYDFSKDPTSLKTIEPIEEKQHIGQREKLSRFDVIKINKYYACGEKLAGCKDKLTAKECMKKGLGLNIEKKIMYPNMAGCKDEKWSEENCPKTCGDCYRLFEKQERK